MTKYSEKLKDPRWQKKRLGILARDEWCCQQCFDGEDTLIVHHLYYERGMEPWDYPDEGLITLCESCHEQEREDLDKAENRLFAAIRKCFLARGVDMVAEGFEDLSKLEPAKAGSEFTAEAIALALGDKETVNLLHHIRQQKQDEYHAQIAKDKNPK